MPRGWAFAPVTTALLRLACKQSSVIKGTCDTANQMLGSYNCVWLVLIKLPNNPDAEVMLCHSQSVGPTCVGAAARGPGRPRSCTVCAKPMLWRAATGIRSCHACRPLLCICSCIHTGLVADIHLVPAVQKLVELTEANGNSPTISFNLISALTSSRSDWKRTG